VNAAGGTPAQNADLADQVSVAMQRELQTFVKTQIREATRKGNDLNPSVAVG
jgi:hypothetical protein